MFFKKKTDLEKRLASRRRHWRLIKVSFMIIAIVAIVLTVANPFRFDFTGGTHRITPTAVDTDIWGNYKVYFKTSDLTLNNGEDFYYIQKGDKELIDYMERAIVEKNEVVIYYDRYVGYKGFMAPKTSPIVKIDTIKPTINTPSGKQLNMQQINLLRMIYGKGGML